eukprot:TRINITY_DN75131_c0_g1_i1.p1 TRINITY_DN75131_c0_g1~~TRINITY_DN75131_c0_g1_i1.p1  ORF type:complete len:726 (+),score=149.90 TRINITY_DN75131_c0_g1_i1:48-2225(+)
MDMDPKTASHMAAAPAGSTDLQACKKPQGTQQAAALLVSSPLRKRSSAFPAKPTPTKAPELAQSASSDAQSSDTPSSRKSCASPVLTPKRMRFACAGSDKIQAAAAAKSTEFAAIMASAGNSAASSVSSSEMIPCEQCDMLIQLSELEEHERSHFFQCELCERMLLPAELFDHIRLHEEQQRTLEHWQGKRAKHVEAQSSEEHSQRSTNSGSNWLSAPQKENFSSSESLVRSPSRRSLGPESGSDAAGQPVKVPCEYCGLYILAAELEAHEKTHSQPCLHCFAMFLPSELPAHQRTHEQADQLNLGGNSVEAIAARIVQEVRRTTLPNQGNKSFAINFDLALAFVQRHRKMVFQRGPAIATPKEFFHWTPQQNIESIMDQNLQVPQQGRGYGMQSGLGATSRHALGRPSVSSIHGAVFGPGIYGSPDFEYGRSYGRGAQSGFAGLALTGVQANANGVVKLNPGDGRLFEIPKWGGSSVPDWQPVVLEAVNADGSCQVQPLQFAGPLKPIPGHDQLRPWGKVGDGVPPSCLLSGHAYEFAPGCMWQGTSVPLSSNGAPLLAMAVASGEDPDGKRVDPCDGRRYSVGEFRAKHRRTLPASKIQEYWETKMQCSEESKADWLCRTGQQTQVRRSDLRNLNHQKESKKDHDSVAEQKWGASAEEWVLPESDQVLPCFLVDAAALPEALKTMETVIRILNEAANIIHNDQVLDDDDADGEQEGSASPSSQ